MLTIEKRIQAECIHYWFAQERTVVDGHLYIECQNCGFVQISEDVEEEVEE